MEFIKTHIPDVLICKPKIINDVRGYFYESYKKSVLEDFIGAPLNFIQDNEAKSTKGVLRGLHFQKGAYAQAKLVQVVKGKVLDVGCGQSPYRFLLNKNSKSFIFRILP